MDSDSIRLRLRLSYDGTDFFGWQRQPNTEQTIQGLIEAALAKIYNKKIAVVASGRTDRGVHALNQWAHMDLPKNQDHANLQYKLGRMLPESVSIKSVEEASSQFHAQISAVSKCYFYRLGEAKPRNPFLGRYSWQYQKAIDFQYLQELSSILLGEHDFTSFQSQGTPVSTPVRKIMISRWIEKKPGLYEYQIKGNGFLKQMVRNIVGTMIRMMEDTPPTEELKSLINQKNRQLAAAPAPARGLFLSSVQYPEELDNKCRKL